MSGGPYTRGQMKRTPAASETRDGQFDGLQAEAKASIGQSANVLRAIRERYREAYNEELARWQALREDLDARQARLGGNAAMAGAHKDEAELRALRVELELLTAELGQHQSELQKIDLASRSLENSWLFLERGDASLVHGEGGANLSTDIAMQIVEAQEGERSRLAQEIHDGPAQALSNAIFQVEFIERVLERDPAAARTELRYLRELLRRELGDVRSYISQLRPPRLVQLGLEGAIRDTIENLTALTGMTIETDLAASAGALDEASQTVVLRVVQEALQNVRKHASASRVRVASRRERRAWIVEVRDDGRGFDVAALGAPGRRNFGLQFMRERAVLIGATFDVRSRLDGGTIVSLAIPIGEERG